MTFIKDKFHFLKLTESELIIRIIIKRQKAMIKVFLFLFAGILAGFFCRSKKELLNFFEKAGLLSVFVLLFLFGVDVGLNDQIIKTFYQVGFNGITLAVGAVMGSILIMIPVYMFIFKKKDSK